jgi:DNA-binding NarL/FixJ family response regulator
MTADEHRRAHPERREVLRLMAGGFSNREIARALATAEGTVKNQVSSVLSKLGVRDRTRAVLRALELAGCERSGAGARVVSARTSTASFHLA